MSTMEGGKAVKENGKLFEGLDDEQIKMMSEMCIEIDDKDIPLGPKSKVDLHIWENIQQGLLHRAFSVFLIDGEGRLLLQQRAGSKITFPLFWANTCCSHPWHNSAEMDLENAMGVKRAAVRKLEQELGIDPAQVPLGSFEFLTRIHYKAKFDDQWGEHEIDHVLILRPSKDVVLKPNPNEIEAVKWVNPGELKGFFANAKENGDLVAPWFELIAKTFLLPKWWGSLDSLKELRDEEIHYLEL